MSEINEPFDPAISVCDLTNLYIDGGEGGVNTYLGEKAAYFTQHTRSVSHSVIVPGRRDEVRQWGATTVHTIASPRYFRNPQHRILFNRGKLARILRSIRPQVVEVDCVSFLGRIARAALRNQPPALVGFYHVHLPTFFARECGRKFGSLGAAISEHLSWRFVKRCLRSLDRIVVSSQDMHQRLEAQGIRRLVTIPLGVNTRLFQPLNGRGRPASESHAVVSAPRPIRTILYVGRLSREKQLKVLLDAFQLLSRGGDYRLKVIGEGPERNLVEKFARGRTDVEFCGLCPYGPDLARHYREAAVLALPSPAETFGLTILEALASGIPVVAMRQGGPTSVLKPGLGALANPGDARDLAVKIDAVARQSAPAEVLRDYVVENFSWSQTFERLLALYRSLAAPPAGSPAPALDSLPAATA